MAVRGAVARQSMQFVHHTFGRLAGLWLVLAAATVGEAQGAEARPAAEGPAVQLAGGGRVVFSAPSARAPAREGPLSVRAVSLAGAQLPRFFHVVGRAVRILAPDEKSGGAVLSFPAVRLPTGMRPVLARALERVTTISPDWLPGNLSIPARRGEIGAWGAFCGAVRFRSADDKRLPRRPSGSSCGAGLGSCRAGGPGGVDVRRRTRAGLRGRARSSSSRAPPRRLASSSATGHVSTMPRHTLATLV